MNNYDLEPVYYCKHCLSLLIKTAEGVDFCGDCGSADIETTDIFTWQEMYKEKYHKNP